MRLIHKVNKLYFCVICQHLVIRRQGCDKFVFDKTLTTNHVVIIASATGRRAPSSRTSPKFQNFSRHICSCLSLESTIVGRQNKESLQKTTKTAQLLLSSIHLPSSAASVQFEEIPALFEQDVVHQYDCTLRRNTSTHPVRAAPV
jgi:hypothetical protein